MSAPTSDPDATRRGVRDELARLDALRPMLAAALADGLGRTWRAKLAKRGYEAGLARDDEAFEALYALRLIEREPVVSRRFGPELVADAKRLAELAEGEVDGAPAGGASQAAAGASAADAGLDAAADAAALVDRLLVLVPPAIGAPGPATLAPPPPQPPKTKPKPRPASKPAAPKQSARPKPKGAQHVAAPGLAPPAARPPAPTSSRRPKAKRGTRAPKAAAKPKPKREPVPYAAPADDSVPYAPAAGSPRYSGPGRRRRWPRRVLVGVGVCALLGALVAWFGDDLVRAVREDALETDHVPARLSCDGAAHLDPPGSKAALDCDGPWRGDGRRMRVLYVEFDDQAALARYARRRMRRAAKRGLRGVPDGSCRRPGHVAKYRIEGDATPAGRAICFVDELGARIEWSHRPSHVYAIGIFGSYRPLYRWWRLEAGPKTSADDDAIVKRG